MEKIDKKVEWLRSVKPGDVKIGKFQTPKDCHIMSSIIARWNVEEGRYLGIRVSAVYDKPNSIVTITANPTEVYKQ
jgi:hypothetical protein